MAIRRTHELRSLAAVAAAALLTLAGSAARAGETPTADGALAFERDLAKAYVDNDPAALDRDLAGDWVVISARGGVAGRNDVVDAVRKHLWVHTKLDISQPRVRIYGNTAVVTYALANAGALGGKKFDVKERETDVLLHGDGMWKAVLSHESFLNE